MAYNKTQWQVGDIITAEKINNIENGIQLLANSNNLISTYGSFTNPTNFSWNEDKTECTYLANGTVSSPQSTIFSSSRTPDAMFPFIAGETYYIELETEDPNLRLMMLPYVTETSTSSTYFYSSGWYTVPTNTIKMGVAIQVVSKDAITSPKKIKIKIYEAKSTDGLMSRNQTIINALTTSGGLDYTHLLPQRDLVHSSVSTLTGTCLGPGEWSFTSTAPLTGTLSTIDWLKNSEPSVFITGLNSIFTSNKKYIVILDTEDLNKINFGFGYKFSGDENYTNIQLNQKIGTLQFPEGTVSIRLYFRFLQQEAFSNVRFKISIRDFNEVTGILPYVENYSSSIPQLLQVNATDLCAAYGDLDPRLRNDVKFEWNKEECQWELSGTASGIAGCTLFHSDSNGAFSSGPFKAGRTYFCELSSSNPSIYISYSFVPAVSQPGSSAVASYFYNNQSTYLNIPDDKTAIAIELRCPSGVNCGEGAQKTIVKFKILEAPEPKIINNKLDNLSNTGCIDFMYDYIAPSKVDHDVTFSYHDGYYDVSRDITSTGVGIDNFFYQWETLPKWIETGIPYRLIYHGEKVGCQIYWWLDDEETGGGIYYNNTNFTIPTNAVGLAIRLRVNGGDPFTETVKKPQILNTLTNKELTQRANEIEETLSNEIDQIQYQIEDSINNVTNAIGGVSQRVKWLTEKSKGVLFTTEQTTNYSGSSVALSSGASGVAVEEIGGKTIVMNQLVPNRGGTVQTAQGRRYLYRTTGTETLINGGMAIECEAGDELFDLTLMFGKAVADTIMTPEQAYALGCPRILPGDTGISYNTGELMSARVDGIKITRLVNGSNLITDSMDIPSTVLALAGYGWSAGEIYNSIEYNAETGKWTYVRRVASVDLGTLIWHAFPASDNVTYPGFDAEITNKKKVSNGMTCEKYFTGSSATSEMRTNMDNCEIRRYTPNAESTAAKFIAIRDDAFAGKTPEEVGTALNGVTLYYALETPVEIDITDRMPPYHILSSSLPALISSSSPMITFHNENDMNYFGAPCKTTEFIKLSEAI